MKTKGALLALATAANAAYFDNATFGPGPGLENFVDVLTDANVVDNINGTAAFDLVYQGGFDAPTLNLTVNVTRYSTTLQTVNTVYSLGFPSNASANATVGEVLPHERGQTLSNFNASTPLCATIVQTLFSANITNSIDGSSDNGIGIGNGNCFLLLGIRCANAITKAFVDRLQSESNEVCPGNDLDLSDIEECDDVFGDDFKSSTLNLNSANSSLSNGEAFWYNTFEGENVTAVDTGYFQAESSRLHMVIFQAGGEITPICVRANTTVEANEDDPSTGAARLEGGGKGIGGNGWGLIVALMGMFVWLI